MPVNMVVPKPYNFLPIISSSIGNRDCIYILTSIVPYKTHVLIYPIVGVINSSFQDSYPMLVYFVLSTLSTRY